MKKTQIIKYLIALFASAWSPTLAAMEDPSACTYLSDCTYQNNWFFEADLLVWSTNFNTFSGIDVGIQTTDTTADATFFLMHSGRNWDPGVRLTAGWSCNNNWGIQGRWTYFYNSVSNSKAPFDLLVNTDGFHANGGSKFALKYNALDLELENILYLSPCMIIRPLVGIHALWTETQARLNFAVPAQSGTSLDTDGFAVMFNPKNSNWAIGPKLGVNSDWGNFKGFSLIGNVFGALVYGQHKAQINAEVDVTSDVDIRIHLVDSAFWELLSVLQFQTGISFSHCLFQCPCRVDLLWEANLINEARNTILFDKSISMQGLTLKMGFAF